MQTSRANNARILRIKNAKLLWCCFFMNANIWGGFQICISVPLIDIFYLKLSLVNFDSWLRISVSVYSCLTVVCSAWDALVVIPFYTWSWAHLQRVERSRQMRLCMPYSKSPAPYSSMFCSKYPTWNSIYIRSWTHLYGVENSG